MPKRARAKPTASVASPTSAQRLRSPLLGAAAIALSAYLAYRPALSGGFILDDDLYLSANPLIKAGDGLYKFWLSGEALDYYPVSNTSLWLEWRLWGMNPTGYHVTNVALHIGAALCLWAIAAQLSVRGALLAALLFAVHPVNVESVAWIAQRKGLLALLFSLLSIHFFLRSDGYPWGERFYWLSLGCFVLAMLSKGSVATVPALLLIIVASRRSLTKADLVRIAPFLAVSAVLIPVNMWFQARALNQQSLGTDFLTRVLGAATAICFYLGKAVLPIGLAFLYPQWRVDVHSLVWWLPLFAVVIVTVCLWILRRRQLRPLWFVWLYFCVSLVPVLGFADVGFLRYAQVADHYQYLAIAGVVVLGAAVWDRWDQRDSKTARAGGAAIVAVLALLAWRQARLYKDAVTLYEASLLRNPGAWVLHNNLAPLLFDRGRMEDSLQHLRRAVELQPDYFDGRYNLAVVLEKTGRRSEAIEQYEQALKRDAAVVEAQLAVAKLLEAEGRTDDAVAHLIEAVRAKPDSAETHNKLGAILSASNRLPEAIEHFTAAVHANPGYVEARYNLATALGLAGRFQDSIDEYQRYLKLDPASIEGWLNLGFAYSKLAKTAEATRAGRKALELARSRGQAEIVAEIEDFLKSQSLEPDRPGDSP